MAPSVGSITRVHLSTLHEEGSLHFTDQVLSGGSDDGGNMGYFGTFGGMVIKVNLEEFSVVDQLNVVGVKMLVCGAVDSLSMFLFP